MRVLVCGGRDYSDREKVIKELTLLRASRHQLIIIEGGARGADALAAEFAKNYWIPHVQYKADWEKHGKAAGPIRNKQMIEEGKPDLVLAFPGGRGTANMIAQAKAAGIPVREVSP